MIRGTSKCVAKQNPKCSVEKRLMTHVEVLRVQDQSPFQCNEPQLQHDRRCPGNGSVGCCRLQSTFAGM